MGIAQFHIFKHLQAESKNWNKKADPYLQLQEEDITTKFIQ